MAHVLEELSSKSERLIKDIKRKYKENKSLARQIIAGARETADYTCDDDRWSMKWYIIYVRELETRV